ncbi:MAG: winged helix-turn-helix domain-containing protein [Thiolinea sp.]
MAWARTYLKKFGFLENSTRGVWALTSLAKERKHVDPQVVAREVREADRVQSSQKATRQNMKLLSCMITMHLKRRGGVKSYITC